MSFSIDPDSFLSIAASMFNSLFPIFAVPVGIAIALGLLKLIVSKVSQAF